MYLLTDRIWSLYFVVRPWTEDCSPFRSYTRDDDFTVYLYLYYVLPNIHIFCSFDSLQIPLLYISKAETREKKFFSSPFGFVVENNSVFFLPTTRIYLTGSFGVFVYGSFYSLVLSITQIFFIYFFFLFFVFC